MTSRTLLLGAALAALAALPAAADPVADAQAHIDKAQLLFKQNDFPGAIAELDAAYVLDPQPGLLYAIGQAENKLGHCAEAATFYNKFIATKPGDDAVAATMQAIASCKGEGQGSDAQGSAAQSGSAAQGSAAAQGSGSAASATGPAPTAPSPAAWYGDHLGVGLTAGGLVAEVVALVLYKSALSTLDDADAEKMYQAQQRDVDKAHGQRTTALVFGLGGAALLGAGIYHLVRAHDREASVVVTPAPGGAAVTWTGHF